MSCLSIPRSNKRRNTANAKRVRLARSNETSGDRDYGLSQKEIVERNRMPIFKVQCQGARAVHDKRKLKSDEPDFNDVCGSSNARKRQGPDDGDFVTAEPMIISMRFPLSVTATVKSGGPLLTILPRSGVRLNILMPGTITRVDEILKTLPIVNA
ncbi:Hypothetical protein CINCED_3A010558 [Cinara cedri]|uniref:Uncharacterized protein n=1 Tax=Cinara cedri TaxID=506608 RepID=A0A5E4NPT2_9HEMI|nr:Hypothetical protein CINCED_3A010558 [Cinara cedri]